MTPFVFREYDRDLIALVLYVVQDHERYRFLEHGSVNRTM